MDDSYLEKRLFWKDLNKDLKDLLKESILLVNKVAGWEEKFHDYSFIVFPAAKAYEGYLKEVFLRKGFISREDFLGKHFRIGKALNPMLEDQYRESEGVFDKIVAYCGNKDLADQLWETWKNCRNAIFHWFPSEQNVIDYLQAKEKLLLILNTLDKLYRNLVESS